MSNTVNLKKDPFNLESMNLFIIFLILSNLSALFIILSQPVFFSFSNLRISYIYLVLIPNIAHTYLFDILWLLTNL